MLYALLIAIAGAVMWRAFRPEGAPRFATAAAVVVSTGLFMPLLQAYGQREFEIVILFVTTAAVYAIVTSREGLGAALVAYATWFKFFPLAFLAYFALRRWRHAMIVFVAVSAVLLALTQMMLGLTRFRAVVELAGVEATASMSHGPLLRDVESARDPASCRGDRHARRGQVGGLQLRGSMVVAERATAPRRDAGRS